MLNVCTHVDVHIYVRCVPLCARGHGLCVACWKVTTFYELDENKMGNGLVWRTADPNTTAFAAEMIRDMRAQAHLHLKLQQ